MTLLHDWRSAVHNVSLHTLCMADVDLIAKESGRRIRAERKRHGWSQDELARRTGWNPDRPTQAQANSLAPSRIGNFEQGTRRVGLEEARILERVLGRPAPYFMAVISEREAAVIAALRHPSGDSGSNPPSMSTTDRTY